MQRAPPPAPFAESTTNHAQGGKVPSNSLFELSALTVESISVMPTGSFEGVNEGHAMTELAASSPTCTCICTSTPSFVAEEEL